MYVCIHVYERLYCVYKSLSAILECMHALTRRLSPSSILLSLSSLLLYYRVNFLQFFTLKANVSGKVVSKSKYIVHNTNPLGFCMYIFPSPFNFRG